MYSILFTRIFIKKYMKIFNENTELFFFYIPVSQYLVWPGPVAIRILWICSCKIFLFSLYFSKNLLAKYKYSSKGTWWTFVVKIVQLIRFLFNCSNFVCPQRGPWVGHGTCPVTTGNFETNRSSNRSGLTRVARYVEYGTKDEETGGWSGSSERERCISLRTSVFRSLPKSFPSLPGCRFLWSEPPRD